VFVVCKAVPKVCTSLATHLFALNKEDQCSDLRGFLEILSSSCSSLQHKQRQGYHTDAAPSLPIPVAPFKCVDLDIAFVLSLYISFCVKSYCYIRNVS